MKEAHRAQKEEYSNRRNQPSKIATPNPLSRLEQRVTYRLSIIQMPVDQRSAAAQMRIDPAEIIVIQF